MLFDNNDGRANERILHKTKPNMILGCKKAIYGVVLLAIVFIVSPGIIQFIGEMQVYLISYVKLSLTRYAAIAFFIVILFIILYIIWQLLKWYSIEYILTDTRIIIKSGILSTKKNYMPYTTIQDINTSQSIFARLFNVGTVYAFSAYDNNQVKIENISNPSKVEEIIFSNMMGYRRISEPSNGLINNSNRNIVDYEQNNYVAYSDRNEFVDDFEPITPITHERISHPKKEYDYYPEEFSFDGDIDNKYEYEPYDDGLEYNMTRAMNNYNDGITYEGASNSFSNESYYNQIRNEYSYTDDDNYQNNGSEIHYNNSDNKQYKNDYEYVDEKDDSSETIIKRHFDKFKK